MNLATRDAKRCGTAKEELLAGGGVLKVPCLRIEDGDGEVQWIYEPGEIIQYLDQRVAG